MSSENLSGRGVVELSRLIHTKALSPVELMRDSIAAIEAGDGAINAIVIREFERGMEGARRAEAAVMAGGPLGALHGIPYAIKDCFDFRPGWRNTFGGVKALEHFVATAASYYPERVEKLGAVALGKSNSPVFGFRGTTDNPLFGPTRNPFDLSRNAGGSSGGAAAAVAAGLLPFAEGGDGGGSIRIPAAWCNLYGLKPSWGRTPLRTGANRFSAALNPFVHEGSMTRSVADAALLLTLTAGEDRNDPFSWPSHGDFMPDTRRSIHGMRIAYTRNYDIYPVEPEVADAVDRAVGAFEEAGAIVEEVTFGIRRTPQELSDIWCRLVCGNSVLAVELLAADGWVIPREDLPHQLLAWLDHCRSMTLLEHLRDQVVRTEIHEAFQTVFDRYDLIVSPTLAAMPVVNADDRNTVGPSEIQGQPIDPLIGWCLTYLCNFTGHPAASVPAGLGPSGLPVGLQIIGRRNADGDVIAASAAFERLRPWQGNFEICRRVVAGEA